MLTNATLNWLSERWSWVWRPCNLALPMFPFQTWLSIPGWGEQNINHLDPWTTTDTSRLKLAWALSPPFAIVSSLLPRLKWVVGEERYRRQNQLLLNLPAPSPYELLVKLQKHETKGNARQIRFTLWHKRRREEVEAEAATDAIEGYIFPSDHANGYRVWTCVARGQFLDKYVGMEESGSWHGGASPMGLCPGRT